MNSLQLKLIFDVLLAFVVIASVSTLCVSRSNVWAVGHASLLGSGGLYAIAALDFGLGIGQSIALAFAGVVLWSGLLGLAAARLSGDAFVVVSLAGVYATIALMTGRFGEAALNLPMAQGGMSQAVVVVACALFALIYAGFLTALGTSSLETALIRARDQPVSLRADGVEPGRLTFATVFVSGIPIGVMGIASAVFHGSYSPASHSVSACLMLFAVGFPFGVGSVLGAVLSALFLHLLDRVADIALSSSGLPSLLAGLGMPLETQSFSQHTEITSQVIVGLLFLVTLQVWPEGLLGVRSRWIRS